MKIISLFNGCSGAYLGAIQAGFEVTEYHYSEIDKPANKVTQHNIPFAVNLGDVRKVKGGDYQLCIFGSPCQGFSIAGKRLNFADERSMLFFEALRILRECQAVNPNIYWIMENVASMAADIKTAISRELGINPLEINSALVSAQNRQRYYWTNIDKVQQPKDMGILLKDILQADYDKKYLHTAKAMDYMNRKVKDGRTHWDFAHHSDSKNDKSKCITACFAKGVPYNTLVDGDIFRRFTPIEVTRLQTMPDNWFYDKDGQQLVSSSQVYKMTGNGFTTEVIAHILKHIPK